MNSTEFEAILDTAVSRMNAAAKAGATGYDSAQTFEQTVLAELRVACGDAAKADPTFHEGAFPDIMVNGFGVEVKFTTRGTWHGTGNSIFEGMRDERAQVIYLVYCRADLPEIRWKPYEECIKGVRISHSPRYMIDMESDRLFFEDLGMSHDDFRRMDLRDQMKRVVEHVKQRLKPGERVWWFDEEASHTLPVEIRLYRRLDMETKTRLRAEAALMCPQIFKGSRKRDKYDDAAMYLLTQYGVFAPQTRDLFTAGSVAGKERGGDYLLRSLKHIETEIRAAALRLSDALFVEYWGFSCLPEQRISKWLEMADAHRPDNPPSQHLFIG